MSEPAPPPSSPPTTISTNPYQQSTLHSQTALLHKQQIQNQQSELDARKISQHSKLFLFFWNIYSAIAVFVTMLITIESILGVALTVGATLITHYSAPDENDNDNMTQTNGGEEWNGQLPSVLLSFAVITPLSSSISMAFTRRENALRSLASYKSALYNLYVAHASWDWGECHKAKGRRGCVENLEDVKSVAVAVPVIVPKSENEGEEKSTQQQQEQQQQLQLKQQLVEIQQMEQNDQQLPISWIHHSDTLLTHLITLSDSLHQYLTLPTATRARHRVTSKGISEARTVLTTAQSLFTLNTAGRMISISQLCEALKYRGLPGNEASRIRQWENMMTTAMEELRVVKEYRTPQALRSFGRLFTLVLPPLYAPSYVQVARDSNSLALGIVLGIVTSLALTGLFECLTHLEDPFVAHVSLDGIDVREELVVLSYGELMMARRMLFPEEGEFVLNDGEDDGGSGIVGESLVDLRVAVSGKNRMSRHQSNRGM